MSEPEETPEQVAKRLVTIDGRDVTSPVSEDMRIIGDGVSHAPPPGCTSITVGFGDQRVAVTTFHMIRSAIAAALRERDEQWRERMNP